MSGDEMVSGEPQFPGSTQSRGDHDWAWRLTCGPHNGGHNAMCWTPIAPASGAPGGEPGAGTIPLDHPDLADWLALQAKVMHRDDFIEVTFEGSGAAVDENEEPAPSFMAGYSLARLLSLTSALGAPGGEQAPEPKCICTADDPERPDCPLRLAAARALVDEEQSSETATTRCERCSGPVDADGKCGTTTCPHFRGAPVEDEGQRRCGVCGDTLEPGQTPCPEQVWRCVAQAGVRRCRSEATTLPEYHAGCGWVSKSGPANEGGEG